MGERAHGRAGEVTGSEPMDSSIAWARVSFFAGGASSVSLDVIRGKGRRLHFSALLLVGRSGMVVLMYPCARLCLLMVSQRGAL